MDAPDDGFEPAARYRLSTHVCIRPDADGFLVESALSGLSFRLDTPAVFRLLLALARPTRPAELLARVEEGQRDAVHAFLVRCRASGILTRVDDDGRSEEETGSLAHWEFHDLFFHYRSRAGRNPWPLGATYHLRGRVPSEPALADRPEGEVVALPRPDLARLLESDLPLTAVLEARRTRYGAGPVALTDLGELLFRTCRVTEVQEEPGRETIVRRVYPSAGSLHALEAYVVARRCEGLAPGIYHYRPREHELVCVSEDAEAVQALLQEARGRTGNQLPDFPPVLLVFTARFSRVSAKYQSIAYRVILEEVGALYQTLYLVATAMGLYPCALGAGDPDRFARAVGADFYRESSVGEFVVAGPSAASDGVR